MCKKTRKTGVQKLVIIGYFTVFKSAQTEVKYKKTCIKTLKKMTISLTIQLFLLIL